MKKVFAVAALSVFALTSCKGDYTCDCTIDGNSYTFEYTDVKKKDAEDTCDQQEATYSQGGNSVTCELK